MRERLIELLKNVPRNTSAFYGQFADYLLANGVIALPCKLGDTVWYISTENPYVAFEKELKPRRDPSPIAGILITEDGIYICTENIEDVKDRCDKVGEDYAYLTKKDAEAEIKRRERG